MPSARWSWGLYCSRVPCGLGAGTGCKQKGELRWGELLGPAARVTEVSETEERPRAASWLGPGALWVGGGGEALSSSETGAQAQ